MGEVRRAVSGRVIATHHFAFEGADVRVVARGSELWFVLSDVCRVLAVANPADVARRLDDDERGLDTIDTLTGPQSHLVVSESGLYAVVLTSRKPEARRFRRWVTGEVLPAIRQTGAYGQATPAETVEALALRAMRALEDAVAQQRTMLATTLPKAEALDRISGSDGAVSITDAAKTLGVRPKTLLSWLLRHGWIYRRPSCSRLVAYQRVLDRGWLDHRVTAIELARGGRRMATQVLVTPHGLSKLALAVKGVGAGHSLAEDVDG